MSYDDGLNSELVENAVHAKLSAYEISNPRVWFIQLECYFRFRRITSQQTMFSYVVSQLPTEVAAEPCMREVIDDATLKQLWLHCLSFSTRQILATQSSVPPSSLTETADKIHECFADRFIASTSQQPMQRDDNPFYGRPRSNAGANRSNDDHGKQGSPHSGAD
ncbi:hypothetical protein T265_11851 [Opisthorchis viverrini]|uniref:DUF7041 domain-containing protein n=1 Tax=Opisthorchis viverrini TaxID=6198 RepID=A0A074ZVX6_OPIVI|nr:hypothetical protein T265_11851 [Opisthorchis viverrini]KER19339.1 hypothetical protein T265_11851 [Opisthorchis viverrini]